MAQGAARKPRSKKAEAPAFKAYILRTCTSDLSSYNGFVWPADGHVVAPDWKGDDRCGHGLHGFLWGEGDGGLADWSPDAKWLVAGVNEWVDLTGKVKAPEAWVVHCGDRASATAFIQALGAKGAIVGGTATAGYSGTATAGDSGTATAGDRGTATAGDSGTATAGDRGTATAGDRGTATAGYRGAATAGDRGTATAGYSGTATAGDRGTATAGDSGTATAGDRGTATAGYSGTVMVKWWHEPSRRYRFAIGYPGEDGIKPNTAYRADADGKLVEVLA